MSLDKVIERIRKLRALSTSSNVNEAAAAAAEAQRLMTEHQLEEAKIEQVPEDVGHDGVAEDNFPAFGFITWRTVLANFIAAANGCRLVVTEGGFFLIGLRGRREAVAYLRGLYETEILRLARDADLYAPSISHDSFCYGAAGQIGNRLQAAAEKEEKRFRSMPAAQAALALVAGIAAQNEDYINRVMGGTQPVAGGPGIFDPFALQAGRAAGDSVGLGENAQQLPGAPLRIGAGK